MFSKDALVLGESECKLYWYPAARLFYGKVNGHSVELCPVVGDVLYGSLTIDHCNVILVAPFFACLNKAAEVCNVGT